jgi:excisionase family DNA binding protein
MVERRMSVAQVAERWCCSRQHIYNLINRGELPAFKAGSLIRLRMEDVIAHETRQCEAPKPEPAQPPMVPIVVRRSDDKVTHAAQLAARRIMQRRVAQGK